jgi:light-regulated signal transduction histidine kinase (bacteriophytochrome)
LGKWLRVNIRAVPWLDGELVYCCVGADISESKALEEEIIAHNRALNQMVKERTAALENKNRELESFAYSVSHDLRAPLRSIEGFSRALMDDYRERLDEDGRDFLNRIVNGAVRMDRLINDLLTYSRLGRRGVEYELVDLNELVAVIQEELAENIDAARGRVAVSGELPEVPGDRSMLLVLLQNLVGNAVKYHRAGVAPEVNISSHTRNGECVVAVKDNGIGLDTKYQQKVFDIFQRLHTEDEYPGTGIGLASAKKVVEAHGGRIWYESEPGHGTTFYFKLPARRDDGDGGGG